VSGSQQQVDDFALLVADVFETAGRLRRRGERIARTAGQTQSRWQVLSVCSDGDWTVPRIADRLGIARQSVQRTADELTTAGLACWQENARHRRSALLAPTPRGRRALAALTRAACAENAALCSAMGGALAATRRGLRRLLRALREDELRGAVDE
jgi:DNA-binding MarR family transcriptional regulator